MIYLSGSTNDRIEPALIEAGIGLVVNPKNGYYLRAHRYPAWMMENGCKDERPDNPFNEDQWMNKLTHAAEHAGERLLFIVAPDVYGDSKASLERGMEYAPLLREIGPVAIVAQGTHRLDYPWGDFDCLFLGGKENRVHPKREWKVSDEAAELAREARRRGLAVHMGRCNSWWRIQRARDEMGCTSADGTFIKYRKRRSASDTGDERHLRGESEIAGWIDRLDYAPALWQYETPARRQ